MSRFFLVIAPAFVIVFTLLTVIFRALGTLSPPNPILAGFEQDCENGQPCWHGIVPGMATINDTLLRMRQLGYSLNSLYYVGSDGLQLVVQLPQCDVILSFRANPYLVIEFLHFRRCSGVQLGDVMLFFGEPDDMDICAPKPFLYSPRIIYRSGIVLYLNGDERSPLQDLKEFSLAPARFFRSSRQNSWYGFAPDWRYSRDHIDQDC